MRLPTPARARFALDLAPAPASAPWQVIAITAGVGNGWAFPADVLQASLAKWDNLPCFVDHPPTPWTGPSVAALAGRLTGPTWDAARQGIALTLTPSGPAAATLTAAAAAYLASDRRLPIGLSADLSFYANGQTVTEISEVYSVDLVAHPARGGALIQPAEPATTGGTMLTHEPQPAPAGPPADAPDAAPAQAALSQQLPFPTDWAAEAARLRADLNTHRIELAISQAHLPPPMADLVRARFAGAADVRDDDLHFALLRATEALAALTKPKVTGPSVDSITPPEDNLQAAVDDLLGAPRSRAGLSAKPARLSGIRELYHLLTGDYDMHGGYYADRARFATTADFTGLVANALNKVVVNQWDTLGRAGYDWWNKITRTEHFNSLNTITGTLVGTVGALPTVAEGGEYTELIIGDSPETGTFYKYGGYIPLTLELIDRDDARKLAAYPRELANAGLRKISALVAAVFTDNSAVGPTLADTGALFNSTAVTTAGGHANLLTTALTAAALNTAATAVYNQPQLIKQAAGYYGTGPKIAIDPRYLLVPRALALTGRQLKGGIWDASSNVHAENLLRTQDSDCIVVPEWTDATDWALACDPAIAPAIYVGERFGIMPEIFIAGDSLSPAVFTNDEHRLKVRHYIAVWVNDFRPLHKSNVAG